jgi:hypothetical protein
MIANSAKSQICKHKTPDDGDDSLPYNNLVQVVQKQLIYIILIYNIDII